MVKNKSDGYAMSIDYSNRAVKIQRDYYKPCHSPLLHGYGVLDNKANYFHWLEYAQTL